MMIGERIEGFCYCLCGHSAGKHTVPDPVSTVSKCREPGCICKKYQDSPGEQPEPKRERKS